MASFAIEIKWLYNYSSLKLDPCVKNFHHDLQQAKECPEGKTWGCVPFGWSIQIRMSDLRSLWQGLKLTFWITNPLVRINFTNENYYKVYYPRICSWTYNILTIENCASKWGKLMDGLVQNIVCQDSLNWNQVNSFFNSLQRVCRSCFRFSLNHFRKPSVVFETAGTCSLLVSSIFYFLCTNFGRWPLIFWKTIKGSLHLICIINRLQKWATSEQLKKQGGGGILRLCLDLPIQQKPGYLWSPWVLWNGRFCVLLCCKHNYLLKQQVFWAGKQTYTEKK